MKAAWVVVVLAATIGTGEARASLPLPVVKPDEVRRGALLIADPAQPGRFYEAPLVETIVDVDVRGVLLRGRARQRFANPTGATQDAVYVFPLSEGAAVDELLMLVGDRVIEGRVHEKGKAAAIFEQAKIEGRKASLVVEHRPNVFTTSVANIGPGETVEVEVGWQEVLRYDAGKVSLRVPLMVAPRYAPGGADDEACPSSPGAGAVPSARISAHVEPGFPVASLRSLFHEVSTTTAGRDRYVVQLDGPVPADRDFVLEWVAKPLLAPTAAVFTEKKGDEEYALVLLVPPTDVDDAPVRLPRETIFVVDTSGSMEGTSMEQARAALHVGLDTLAPGDRFDVVQFNSYASRLFDDAMPVTAQTLAQARRYVDGLRAEGGTEMLAALRIALDKTREAARADEHVRQVVFITDGAVTNEAALFAHIQEHLGQTRLFTVGIGSAPNAFFMRKAAEFGRGTFTYVGSTAEVKRKMGELFEKIESPVLSRVEIDWRATDVEEHPRRLPDLYVGEPLVVAAKLRELPTSIRVDGRLRGRPWAVDVELPSPVVEKGVAKLWAKRKIETLVDAEGHGAQHEGEIVALALRHHLVSKYTSLVAVDTTPARGDAASSEGLAAPPGQLPQGGTASTLLALVGAACLGLGVLLVLRRRALDGAAA